MPVRKFRSVEEMKAPVWRQSGDPDLVKVLANLWDIAVRTREKKFTPGVRKFRSIEEMNAAQRA